MKRLLYIFAVLFIAVSCNSDEFKYKDYDKQAVFFPFQYPFRTLSLGNDAIDNSMDRAWKFNIGVNIGGIWKENKNEWTVNVAVDESLVADNLYNADDQKIEVMPESYYEIAPLDNIKIEKGSLVGLMTVQLNEKFFNDPKSIDNIYVIPLRIVSTDADEIVYGKPSVDNPNIHNPLDWNSGARDKSYTLFGVKYVNPYHGKFLRRGKIEVKSPQGDLIETIVIRTSEPERNQVVNLVTESMDEVLVNYAGNDNSASQMRLIVDPEDNSVEVAPVEGSAYQVSGTGEWEYNGDSWGVNLDGTPKVRDVFRLAYEYTDADGNTCSVRDTVVFRDRQIIFENVDPVIK